MPIDPTAIIVAVVTTAPLMVTAVVQNTRLGRRLRTVEQHTSTAVAELTPNHGSSAKDAILRLERVIEEGQKETREQLVDVREDIGGLRSELRTERRERLAVAERVVTVEQRVAGLEQRGADEP